MAKKPLPLEAFFLHFVSFVIKISKTPEFLGQTCLFIPSPGYPRDDKLVHPRRCMWTIQGPEGRAISLNIEDLDLMPVTTQTHGGSSYTYCRNEMLFVLQPASLNQVQVRPLAVHFSPLNNGLTFLGLYLQRQRPIQRK